MTALFPVDLFDRLRKLSRLFIWRRKSIHDDIAGDLRAVDIRHVTLMHEHQDTLARLQVMTQEKDQVTQHLTTVNAELTRTRQDFQGLQQAKQQLHKLLETESAAGVALQNALAEEQTSYQNLTNEFNVLERQHRETSIRFQLVSELLDARPIDNDGLADFRKLLENDYMDFAESESSLAAEAKALLMLQMIERELCLLGGFPDVSKRKVVGIVGGFSAGKSEFINSFILDSEIRLAVGIQPVTVIPSYVLATTNRLIRGYSANGGYVELDAEFYKSISHAFIKSFCFDLKSIMPFMCVGVQMDSAYFSNICFIDTPGYNPPTTARRYSQSDKHTAVTFAQQSDAIVWLISIDAGTISGSDLKFIQEIGIEHRSVYVVLNKADLKPEEDIKRIMDEVESILEYENISTEGMSAYSSTQRRVIAHRGLPLMNYFRKINVECDVKKQLEARLNAVFDMYDNAIHLDIEKIQQQKRSIKGLHLDALETGGQVVYEKMHENICMLDQKLDTAPFENWLSESQRLRRSFTDAIRRR